MSRCIDADKLRKDVLDLPNPYNGFSDTYDKELIVDLIDEQPTVDAVPVRHGRWIDKPRCHSSALWKYPVVECSKCGAIFCDLINNHREIYHYCPKCGCVMDEVDE